MKPGATTIGMNFGLSTKDGVKMRPVGWLGDMPLIRLDYHPIPGSGGEPVLHLNIGSGDGKDSIHIPIWSGNGPSIWQ